MTIINENGKLSIIDERLHEIGDAIYLEGEPYEITYADPDTDYYEIQLL